MSYLNNEDILSLITASEQYGIQLADPFNTALQNKDPNKLSYGEFSSILQGKGLAKPEDLSDERFVLGYIFNDDYPARQQFTTILDEQLPEHIDPAFTSQPSGWDITAKPYARPFVNFLSAFPTGLNESIRQSVDAQRNWDLMDWKELGRYAWEDSWEGGDIIAKMGNLYKDADGRRKAAEKERKKAGLDSAPWTKRPFLDVTSDVLNKWTDYSLKKYNEKPSNRAYQLYMHDVREKGFWDRSVKEHWAFLNESLASTTAPILGGGVTYLATRNPTLARQVGLSMAGGLEYSDEFHQGRDYWIEQGYTPELATRMTHQNSLMYTLLAMRWEQLTLNSFIPKASKDLLRNKLWKDLSKKIPDAITKAGIPKTVKTITPKIAQKSGIVAAEVGVENLQLLTQTAIQAGYKGEFDTEKFFEESGHTSEAAATATSALLLLTGLGGKARGMYQAKGKAITEEPTAEKEGIPAAKPIERIKPSAPASILASVLAPKVALSPELIEAKTQLGADALDKPGMILNALKKDGEAALKTLGLTKEEAITQIDEVFGDIQPDIALQARNILGVKVTPTKEKEAAEELPEDFARPGQFAAPTERVEPEVSPFAGVAGELISATEAEVFGEKVAEVPAEEKLEEYLSPIERVEFPPAKSRAEAHALVDGKKVVLTEEQKDRLVTIIEGKDSANIAARAAAEVELLDIGRELIAQQEAPAEGPTISPEDMKESFQRLAQGRMPLVTAKPEQARIIREDVAAKYPQIKLVMEDMITDEAGMEVAGRALNDVAYWSKTGATLDTAPHESLHLLTNSLEKDKASNALLQKAYKEVDTGKFDDGGREEFHQYAGEYYATNTLKGKTKGFISKFKTALRKVWTRIKKVLGKPAEYVAEQYFEKGPMFQDVKVDKDIRLAKQLAINEASMKIKDLTKQYGIEFTRHPTDKTRIGDIKIPDKFQTQGIGRQFVDALKLESKGLGQNIININAKPGTEGFWEKMGFKWTGEVVETEEAVDPSQSTAAEPPINAYKPWIMQYTIPEAEMVFDEILYQPLSPESRIFKDAEVMLDNAFERIKVETGKKVPLVEFIDRMSEILPDRLYGVMASWQDKIKKKYPGIKLKTMTEAALGKDSDYFTNPEEFEHAFRKASQEITEGLAQVDFNDKHISAEFGDRINDIFLSILNVRMTEQEFAELASDARDIDFKTWIDTSFSRHTKRSYDNLNGRGKRIAKRMWVQANSTIKLNLGTLNPKRRNLMYDSTSGLLVVKGPINRFNQSKNAKSGNKFLYEATGKPMKSNIIWLSKSDILEQGETKIDQYTPITEYLEKIRGMTVEDYETLDSKARDMAFEDDGINGMVMFGVRGDRGGVMFAAITDEHMDIALSPEKLKAYWTKLVKAKDITGVQARQLIGYRKDDNGDWIPGPNANNTKWLAGEIARMEAYGDLMPLNMTRNGSEFLRRIKIATSTVFTSPAMRDFSVRVYDPNEIVFIDKAGNEATGDQYVLGMKDTKNRSDGGTMTSKALFESMKDAFGTDGNMAVAKTVIWKKDLSLAVKHQQHRPPAGLEMYRVDKKGNRILYAQVDGDGNITLADGTEVDMLMTKDEAKILGHDLYKNINVEGNELGLIKYHNKKDPKARFPIQWMHYAPSDAVNNVFKGNILPKMNRWLDRMYMVSKSEEGLPTLVYNMLKVLKADSPFAVSNSLVDKAELGLGHHPDAEPMLNTLIKTQIIEPAVGLSYMKGAYLDVSPDYSGKLKDTDVSIADNDASAVRSAYAKAKRIQPGVAKDVPIDVINKWLEDNPVDVIISRSPVPAVQGIYIGKVVELHDRDGQIMLNTETAISRLEADWDGDAVQVEFADAEVIAVIQEELDTAEEANRMGAIDMSIYPSSKGQFQDFASRENMYNLSSKASMDVIGEIGNVQSIYGQLLNTFNFAMIDGNYIQIRKLDQKMSFPETGETGITLEQIYRRWLQAAVDNGKLLLLDDWNYSQERLLRAMFYRQDAQGNMLGPITDGQWKAMSVLTNKHKIPGYIRNGEKPDKQYDLSSILLESQKYDSYVKDRARTIMREATAMKYYDETGMDYTSEVGKMTYIEFKPNKTAPIEDIAVSIARGWNNNDEIGKITPIKYEDDIYRNVHLQSLKDLQENNDKNIANALEQDAFETEKEKLTAVREGQTYVHGMWGNFAKLMKKFTSGIGPVSWDRNEDLAVFADKWNVQYKELSETGKTVATIQFLRLTHTLKDSEVSNQRNRRMLPPFSSNENATLLHPEIMEQYLAHYNKRILDPQGRTLEKGAFANNESFESMIKDLC